MVIIKTKTWGHELEDTVKSIEAGLYDTSLLDGMKFDSLCHCYLCAIYFDCEKVRRAIEKIFNTLDREFFIIPIDLFKHLNPSMFGTALAQKVWESTPETTNRLVLDCYSYFPPAYALMIATVEAIAFDKKDVAKRLKEVIKRCVTIDAVMPKFFELVQGDPKMLARLSELIEYCKSAIIADSDITEDLDVNEDIEKHDDLNPKLFNGKQLKPEVKEKSMEIANELIKTLTESEVPFVLKDVVLTGSNASYNYTKDSDIDIHLIVDTPSTEDSAALYQALFNAFKSTFNSKYTIDFYDIPVEVYIETAGTPVVSNGIYSVLNDAWVKEPENEAIPDIDLDAIAKALKPWEKRYKKLIKEIEGPDSLNELPIDEFLEDLYTMRKEGLANNGEYSTENLVFKELRNKGYLDKIKDLRNTVIANRLSLHSLKEAYLDAEQKFFNYGTQTISSASNSIDKQVGSNFGAGDLLRSGGESENYPTAVSEIMPMTPMQYFQLCASLQGCSADYLIDLVAKDTGVLNHLEQVLTKYKRSFPMPYLCFDQGCELYGQEGRHRMYVLGELYGWNKKYPVQVIQSKVDHKSRRDLIGEGFTSTEEKALADLAKIASKAFL